MAESRPVRETELYPPVKAFLEAQGYAVKGEVEGCDLVAVRGEEAPVVVELKTSFTLGLVIQGIARQGVTDNVYLGVPPFSGRTTRRKDAMALCRRLGVGLLTVRLDPDAFVQALVDPAVFRPRKRKVRLGRLLREFERRVGDPNEGGTTRRGLMTAYRQDALRCASCLARTGAAKAAMVARVTGVVRAGSIMYADHYGWFERPFETPRGVYSLTPKGRTALEEHADTVSELESASRAASEPDPREPEFPGQGSTSRKRPRLPDRIGHRLDGGDRGKSMTDEMAHSLGE